MAKVMELVPERDLLLLRAGVGWKPGVVGSSTAGTDIRSAAGYALKTETPVISEDVMADPRFDLEAVVRAHSVISSANGLAQKVRSGGPRGNRRSAMVRPLVWVGA
jgi:hypothetical protein